MLGLGASLTSEDVLSEVNQFLSFDGTDDKAESTLNEAARTILSGTDDDTDDMANNISISMWIKPTWDAGAGDLLNVVPFLYIGNSSDVHESIRIFYQIETTAGSNKNQIAAESRSSASNTRSVEFANLGVNTSITTTGGTPSTVDDANMWDSGNPGNVNSDGFIHLFFSKAGNTSDWQIFWQGQALSTTPNDSGILSIADEDYDIISVGRDPAFNHFGNFGIKHLAIYHRSLSIASDLYNSGVMADPRELASTDYLSVYYPFNENGNDVVNGLNLTITGATFTQV